MSERKNSLHKMSLEADKEIFKCLDIRNRSRLRVRIKLELAKSGGLNFRELHFFALWRGLSGKDPYSQLPKIIQKIGFPKFTIAEWHTAISGKFYSGK